MITLSSELGAWARKPLLTQVYGQMRAIGKAAPYALTEISPLGDWVFCVSWVREARRDTMSIWENSAVVARKSCHMFRIDTFTWAGL